MYIETSRKNSGSEIFFVAFLRTDKIQNSNISFFLNRYSILNNNSLQSMGRFRNQLI